MKINCINCFPFIYNYFNGHFKENYIEFFLEQYVKLNTQHEQSKLKEIQTPPGNHTRGHNTNNTRVISKLFPVLWQATQRLKSSSISSEFECYVLKFRLLIGYAYLDTDEIRKVY